MTPLYFLYGAVDNSRLPKGLGGGYYKDTENKK